MPILSDRPTVSRPDAADAQTRPSHRIQGLDLIRGLAVGLVMLRHAWPAAFGGAGVTGVVIFFALSGYLITGVLLSDIEKRGGVDYVRFYRNRVLRLYPALVLLVAVFVAVTAIWDPLGERATIGRAIAVALTYVSDWPYIDHGTSALMHLWTLSAEEQFYLLWPALLLLAVSLRRPNTVLLVTGLAIYGICVWSLGRAATAQDVYGWPWSWTVVMVLGAAAKLHEVRVARWLPGQGSGSPILPIIALAVLLLISVGPEAKSFAYSYLVLGPLIGVCTIVLIFWLRTLQTVSTNFLVRAMLYLGTISYAAYLWDYPIVTWTSAIWGSGALVRTLSIPLTILAATLSWFLVEKPIANWRLRNDMLRHRADRGLVGGDGGRGSSAPA